MSDMFGQGPFSGDADPSPQLVEDAGIALDEGVVATRTPSPWRRAFKRLLRDKPAVVALAFLLLDHLHGRVRIADRAARPRRDPRRGHAVRDAEPRPSVRHRPQRHATPSAGSSTARGCRCGSGFQIVGLALLDRGAARAARRVPRRRHRRHAHAGHGRTRQLPTARARARGGRRARRRARERHHRHLVGDDPRLRAADASADARGAGGDVHRGVALDGHEAPVASAASACCRTSRHP